jgi:uncharacterized protein YgbK (DUF1537 family)
MKLLILADDFTGAMDTGCQFAAMGLKTWVLTQVRTTDLPTADVLVINTQTRHLVPSQAYNMTKQVLMALASSYDCIYIKTDSAFRGNLSGVLAAAVDTIGVPMHFAPSYPQVDRTLENGVIYIGEELLEYSVFAKDPRSPMNISNAADIIKMDYPLKCQPVRENAGYKAVDGTQIYLYDCSSIESMERIAESLAKNGRMRLIGGCAGLAGALAPYIRSETKKAAAEWVAGNALIVSGSANGVTFSQLSRREGTKVVNLSREQIRIDCCVDCLKKGEDLIIAAACTAEDVTRDAPESYHIELARQISSGTEALLSQSGCRNLAVFGGDTVQAILNRLECSQVEVLGNLEEGVPVCTAVTKLGSIRLVTKSGGLGSSNVIRNILQHFRGGK